MTCVSLGVLTSTDTYHTSLLDNLVEKNEVVYFTWKCTLKCILYLVFMRSLFHACLRTWAIIHVRLISMEERKSSICIYEENFFLLSRFLTEMYDLYFWMTYSVPFSEMQVEPEFWFCSCRNSIVILMGLWQWWNMSL